MTVVSMTEINDVVEPQESDRKSSSEKESYSLVIVLKSLVLTYVSNDDPRTVEIDLEVGETEVQFSGNLEFLNEQRQGTAISVPVSNPEELKQFLSNRDLLISIRIGSEKLGQCNVPLARTNLAAFDPPAFEPTIISDTFPIIHKSLAIGKIELALKTDRIKSTSGPDGSEPEEDDSMLYVVNDTSPRQSNEYQEDIMRQLLTCKKCNAIKSPSEVSYKYELIDGILVNKEYPKKDPDLEIMKRKIEQIEREAKLYPVGTEQEAPKEREEHCFCNNCGGYSITGATCSERVPALDIPMMEAGFRYPEGSAKRTTATGRSENVAPISEPNFTSSKATEERFNHGRSESFPLHPVQQQSPRIFCPQSVGHRFCHHCGLNMDWLPLHSGCPKCGFRSPQAFHNITPPTFHETTPNRPNSWMGSLELPQCQPRRPSSGTLRSVSVNEMPKPCPICRLRGGCCPDCKKRASTVQHQREQNSTTQSSTSDSEMLPRRVMERPKTRPSLRDRFNVFPKKIDKATRLSELFKAYGDKNTTHHEISQRRTTQSSILSLNVEEILKKTETHKRKVVSGGVHSVELRKVNSNPDASRDGKATERCDSLTHAQIRKNQRSLLKRIKKQNRGKYSYRYGQRYPGIAIGHRECIQQGCQVPPHMGWMWNVKTLGIDKIRKGWRPGAVKKPIKELMQHFLVSYPLDNIPVSKKGGRHLEIPSDVSSHSKPKPTLQIVKKNGEYCIVMNPLKDSAALKTAQDPYLDCEPIRFKLAKDPNVGKLYQLRCALKMKGFTMCGCTELESCEHRSNKEKKLLKKELGKLSKCLGLPKTTELKDVPIDSESELDLEFTPPSAMLNSGQRKPDVVCTETQYSADDYKVQVPADKLKCKPGREDSNDVGKSKAGRGGRNVNTSGKDDKGKGVKAGKDGKGLEKGGPGAGSKIAGAGGKAKAGSYSKAKSGADSKAVVGAKIGTTGKNKAQKIHRPEGGQVVIMKETCKIPGPCGPSKICPPVAAVCGFQPNNACYATPCAPVAYYNSCYT